MKRIFATALIATALFLAGVPVNAAQHEKVELAKTNAERVKEAPPPAENIDITDAAAIEDAETVSKSLTVVTDLVMKCTKENEPPQECPCKFQEELGAVRTAYDAALAKHPDWRDKVVNYRKPGDGNTSVSFPGVAAQLETCN